MLVIVLKSAVCHITSLTLATSAVAPWGVLAQEATIGLVRPAVVATRTAWASVAAMWVPTPTAAAAGFPCGVSPPNSHSLTLPLR